MPRDRIEWGHVLEHASEVVRSYNTGVTLRQAFYRLVANNTLPNTNGAYKGLSRVTAKARREGTFPDFIDRGRTIHRYETFTGPQDARRWLADVYRRDRTEGQEVSLYLGVEKAGIVEQLTDWYGDLGVPVLALGGYSSQTYVNEVVEDTRPTPTVPPCSSTPGTSIPVVRTSTGTSSPGRAAGPRSSGSR